MPGRRGYEPLSEENAARRVVRSTIARRRLPTRRGDALRAPCFATAPGIQGGVGAGWLRGGAEEPSRETEYAGDVCFFFFFGIDWVFFDGHDERVRWMQEWGARLA